jgi:hypothetical protein
MRHGLRSPEGIIDHAHEIGRCLLLRTGRAGKEQRCAAERGHCDSLHVQTSWMPTSWMPTCWNAIYAAPVPDEAPVRRLRSGAAPAALAGFRDWEYVDGS